MHKRNQVKCVYHQLWVSDAFNKHCMAYGTCNFSSIIMKKYKKQHRNECLSWHEPQCTGTQSTKTVHLLHLLQFTIDYLIWSAQQRTIRPSHNIWCAHSLCPLLFYCKCSLFCFAGRIKEWKSVCVFWRVHLNGNIQCNGYSPW